MWAGLQWERRLDIFKVPADGIMVPTFSILKVPQEATPSGPEQNVWQTVGACHLISDLIFDVRIKVQQGSKVHHGMAYARNLAKAGKHST